MTGQFSGQVRRWSEKTQRKMDMAVRKITLDVFSNVILLSPVDTGRFRGNWQPAVGRAVSGTIEAVDPSGATVTAKVQSSIQGVKAGDVIYMVNNLPYAERLENGWSSQAPSGMVALTVQRFQPIADAVIRQIAAQG
ncbi:HK97 gp10 family phage protein [Roseibacterium sp. SDUM158017]|uniref:HK97 gp10 family phage protein n=1 Tax=Roseicyclus salinarum TaxID=3036773 RepID=UPI0024155546|nr:HK97 gp10 family phage protein [Roseibacterium sp. SDUM158017]MDG4650113.1 HK97 gp10 family phage protein [Roseibacterium sp. SDUM158017]